MCRRFRVRVADIVRGPVRIKSQSMFSNLLSVDNDAASICTMDSRRDSPGRQSRVRDSDLDLDRLVMAISVDQPAARGACISSRISKQTPDLLHNRLMACAAAVRMLVLGESR